MPNRMYGDPAVNLEGAGGRMIAVVSKPTIGRIVYYYSRGSADGIFQSEPRAAMVTAVNDNGTDASLAVLHPSGLFFDSDVPYSPTPSPGCWSWPPR